MLTEKGTESRAVKRHTRYTHAQSRKGERSSASCLCAAQGVLYASAHPPLKVRPSPTLFSQTQVHTWDILHPPACATPTCRLPGPVAWYVLYAHVQLLPLFKAPSTQAHRSCKESQARHLPDSFGELLAVDHTGECPHHWQRQPPLPSFWTREALLWSLGAAL